MRDEMLIWSLVFQKIATLQDLETTWSLDDALRAAAFLEMKNALELETQKELSHGHSARASNQGRTRRR